MAKIPASIRYKNPGAMWGGPHATKWGALPNATVKLNDGTGQNNTIAVFPTYADGIAAQVALWRTARYRNKPFKEAIIPWSGGNHVPAYIEMVAGSVPGFTGNTVIDDDFLLGPHGIAFLKAQARHEAGKPYPAPDADWVEGRRRAFKGAAKPAKRKPAAQKPEPPEPAQEAPAPVSTSVEIETVQRRLVALGYPVGAIDGKWGGITAGAIAGFKNDRGLAGEPVIDEALKAEIAKAEAEGFARPIAKARSEATETKAAETAPEIVPAARNRLAALWAGITSFVLMIFNAVVDYFKDALEWIAEARSVFTDVPLWLWAALGLGIALFFYHNSAKSAALSKEAVNKGERL
jgi:hypothetical protein